MRRPRPTKVIVAGAGIGGLTAATALRRAGFEVEIYEAARELRPAGAGISVLRNGIAALRTLGLGIDTELTSVGGVVQSFSIRTPRGATVRTLPGEALTDEVGTPSVAVHRADVQRALLRALGDCPLELGAVITGFEADEDGVLVRLEDGREVFGDVLVGADGIHSVVRAQLHGASEPRPANFLCWLGTTPYAHPRVGPGASAHYWGRGMRFGLHDIGGGRVYWWATTTPAGRAAPGDGSKDELLRLFGDWADEVVQAIVQTPGEAVVIVPAQDRPVLEQWGRGVVTLLGDAAHPMLPSLGQGANIAIEDGVVLAHALASASDRAAGLRRYERLRRERARMIVEGSRRLARIEQTRSRAICRLRDGYFRRAPSRLITKAFEAPMTFPALSPRATLPRPLSPIERWHWIANELAPLHVVSRARVEGRLCPAHLRDALDLLQARHPLLRAAVATDPGEKRPRFVAAPDGRLPLRLVEHDDADLERAWQREIDAHELVDPFDWRSGPLVRGVCISHAGGRIHDVLLTCPYLVGDAETALSLLKQWLELAAGLADGRAARPEAEVALLPPPEEMFPAAARGARGAATTLASALRGQGELVRRRPRRLAASADVPTTDRRTRVVHRALSRPLTHALLAGCAQRRVDPLAPIAAAMVVANARDDGGRNSRAQTLGVSVNFRDELVGVSEVDVGAYQAMISWPQRPDARASMWEMARQVDDAYRSRCERADHLAGLKLVRVLCPSSPGKSAGMVKLMDTKGPGNLCLTSAAPSVFPHQSEELRVSGLQFVSGLSVSGYVMVSITFDDDVVWLSLSYVDGIVTRERAESMIDRALAWLTSGLGEAIETSDPGRALEPAPGVS